MTGTGAPAGPLTITDLLLARRDDSGPALASGDGRWTWRERVAAAAVRAAVAQEHRVPGPFHVGLLLPNTEEYVWWLDAAALCGAVIVGINSTRRGEDLARDIRHTDCQLIVTDSMGFGLLEGLDLGVAADRILRVDDDRYAGSLAGHAGAAPVPRAASPDELFTLLFTSGSTAAPKAVRVSTGRLARGARVTADRFSFRRSDVCYCAMPLFHANSLMSIWAPALCAGAAMAVVPRFTASGFVGDVRRYRATFFNYVGTALRYILAQPEGPQDSRTRLTRGYGTEATRAEMLEFQRRFGVPLFTGYGMSEGGIRITPTPETPGDALGPSETVMIVDPDTGVERDRAQFGPDGRLVNADQAIGEIVDIDGAAKFEGYYRNPEATAEKSRRGWYWSGDLGYRDGAGYVYFAGRGVDRLRVDGENLAAGDIERAVGEYRHAFAVAVYPVPDPLSGDAVMVAIQMKPGKPFDAEDFGSFLVTRDGLAGKAMPRYVRICEHLPTTGSHKVAKSALRSELWSTADAIWWRPEGRSAAFAPMPQPAKDTLYRQLAATGHRLPTNDNEGDRRC